MSILYLANFLRNKNDQLYLTKENYWHFEMTDTQADAVIIEFN